MAFFNELTQKAKNMAAVAADKTKDAAETVKINVAIAGEQKEIDKNYRTIGEWFVNEYEGEFPDAICELVEAIAASKNRIMELETSKAKAAAPVEAELVEAEVVKTCAACGAEVTTKFCPQCGAPVGE